ncbi:K1328 protein, partial [Nothoprocta ornata]|nr:K1328 protein [Nothoprocta ornata]
TGISAKGNLRTRYLAKYQKSETVPVAAPSVSMDPDKSTGDMTGPQVTNDGGMKSASLKDLCPEDKRRIANLIKELARVSEEKEVTEERLKAEQESFEKKIRQLEEQNELIIKEREDILLKKCQQYRECQELLSLYQKYLAEQQEKLSLSLAELSAAKEKEQKVSCKKSSCPQWCLELNGSYLGMIRPQTSIKNSSASKAGSPGRAALSQPCRNNCDCGAEIHHSHPECVQECPGLHRKCNNVISSSKQTSPHHVKPAQPTEQKGNELQSLCPQQRSHCCTFRQAGSPGNVQESHLASPVPGRQSGPAHDISGYSRLSRGSGRNDSAYAGSKETEEAKRLSEERKQQLLLQKMELEVEKERLQHLLAKQEAKLLLKQQQLHQSRMDYNRLKGREPGLEDLPIGETPGELALMMNGTDIGLSLPVSRSDNYFPRTPAVSKVSRAPGSSGGSSSGRKTVGFGANAGDGRALVMQARREGSRSRKGTTSGPRKDAATSPALVRSRKELVTTATSPIQHDTSW